MAQASVGELQGLADEKLSKLAADIGAAERELEAATKRVKEAEKAVGALEATREALAREVSDLNAKAADARNGWTQAQAEQLARFEAQATLTADRLGQLEQREEALAQALGTLQARREQVRAVLTDLLRVYEHAQTTRVAAELRAQDQAKELLAVISTEIAGAT